MQSVGLLLNFELSNIGLLTFKLLSFSLILPFHPLGFFFCLVADAGNGAKGYVGQQQQYHYNAQQVVEQFLQ